MFKSLAKILISSTLLITTKQSLAFDSYEDVERFANAMAQVQYYYLKPVTREQLFNNSIKGMLNELDPHSAYLSPDELSKMLESTPDYVGIGVEIVPNNGMISIVSPFDGSPADLAGIKAGDVILAIDNKLTEGMNISDVVEKITGPEGTEVELLVYRKNNSKPLNIKITRKKITTEVVKYKKINNVGYIRISQFDDETASGVKKAIEQSKADNVIGFVIDLRNNPGGLLTSAVETTDLFIDANKYVNKAIVHTKGRIDENNSTEYATAGEIAPGMPIVVLINEGSASGSEILAGALQDHNRAAVIGQRSFGKGSVQVVLPLDNESAIKVTTATYTTPNNKTIQANGVKPDIIIPMLHIKKNDDFDLRKIMHENNLTDHLGNHNTSINSNGFTDMASKDYQLYQALVLLKGVQSYKD